MILSPRGGGSFAPVPELYAAFNGTKTGGLGYKIGFAYLSEVGGWETLGRYDLGPGTGWESSLVKDPCLIWDGSQFVCFYAGYDGTRYQIGRATSPSIVQPRWTRDGSNPVVPKGGSGDPDEVGCYFPVVHYDPALTPAWKMWYTGNPSGWSTSSPVSTLCFADSSDGVTWTKRGTVIGLGSAGAFNDFATLSGCVYKSGATWYVYVGGFHSYSGSLLSKGGWATCTDPASAATYSALTQLSNYTGTITVGGKTWQSNLPRDIRPADSGYTARLTLWTPTDASTILEVCVEVASADLTAWGTPSELMLPFEPWDALSVENPSIIAAP